MTLIDGQAQGIHRMDPDLAEYIDNDSGWLDPSNVRLRRYWIDVWAIIGYWLGVGRDAQRTAEAYDIPVEYVEAAVRYYQRYQVFIDVRLVQNSI